MKSEEQHVRLHLERNVAGICAVIFIFLSLSFSIPRALHHRSELKETNEELVRLQTEIELTNRAILRTQTEILRAQMEIDSGLRTRTAR